MKNNNPIQPSPLLPQIQQLEIEGKHNKRIIMDVATPSFLWISWMQQRKLQARQKHLHAGYDMMWPPQGRY